MQITTKYDVGDIIKYRKTEKKEIKVTCPFCGGQGEKTDERGITHFCQCEYGELIYEEPGEEIEVTGEIDLIDFRNCGFTSGSNVIMYRCKEDTARQSKACAFDNWVDEPDIISKINLNMEYRR